MEIQLYIHINGSVPRTEHQLKSKQKQMNDPASIVCNGVTIDDKSNTQIITDCGNTTSTTLVITQSATVKAGHISAASRTNSTG